MKQALWAQAVVTAVEPKYDVGVEQESVAQRTSQAEVVWRRFLGFLAIAKPTAWKLLGKTLAHCAWRVR